MKNKILGIIIIVTIIITAIVMIFYGYKIIKQNNSSETVSNSVNNENKIENNTVNTNNSENEVKNTEENVVDNKENEIQNNTTDNKTNENISNNNSSEITGATNEDKAINIVKKNWGNEQGVYFVTMGIDAKGRYIVTVNDSSTTAIFAWYAVNVETGEFEVQ